MGDLSSHNEIFVNTARPMLMEGLGITGSLALCFELGNWLRDVSQFRDPYALQLAKIEKYQEFPSVGGEAVRKKLNNLLGPHYRYDLGKQIVSGAWGEWFKSMITALGVFGFHIAPTLRGIVPTLRGDALAEADFQALFDRYFTQYFPHEHLDFPPTGDKKRLGDWSTTSTRTQGPHGPSRRILVYLDDAIDYVATQVLDAEQNLRRLFAGSQPRNTSWQREVQSVLVRLGRASHALEDYYFHSNFTEIAFFLGSVGDRVEILDLPTYYAAQGVGSLSPVWKRILFRRTRAPRVAKDDRGNAILSKDASDGARYIFTGGFGSADLQHSLHDAFEGLATSPLTRLAIDAINSTLFNYVLLPDKRMKLVKMGKTSVEIDDSAIKDVGEQHLKEVKEQKLVKNAEKYERQSPLFVASVRHANEVDLQSNIENLENENARIGTVLLKLAAQAEATAQNSMRVAEKMDRAPQDRFYLASDNSNSAEDIGTHALMSKDSVRKEPLRKETDELARYAVETMLKILLPQVKAGKDSAYVDWHDLLRRLMCHPAQAPGDWAKKLVAKHLRPAASVFAPTTIPAGAVQRVLQDGGRTTSRLEESYRTLYRAAVTDWEKLTR